jgi:hypothetical protein
MTSQNITLSKQETAAFQEFRNAVDSHLAAYQAGLNAAQVIFVQTLLKQRGSNDPQRSAATDGNESTATPDARPGRRPSDASESEPSLATATGTGSSGSRPNGAAHPTDGESGCAATAHGDTAPST